MHITSIFKESKRDRLQRAGRISAIALIILLMLKLVFHSYFIAGDFASYILMLPLYISEGLRPSKEAS